MRVETFNRDHAYDAAEFLLYAMHELRGRRGMASESAAQNVLYGYLAGRVGAASVVREATPGKLGWSPRLWMGKIDFVVLGRSRTTAVELVVRQQHGTPGTGSRGYVLPGPGHVRDNVTKLLRFQGEREPLRNAFLLVLDRNGSRNALTCDEVITRYKQESWTWRGPTQEWHKNSFQLVVASHHDVKRYNIKNTVQT